MKERNLSIHYHTQNTVLECDFCLVLPSNYHVNLITGEFAFVE